MARRPAQGLSSLFWSMSGLLATLAELEPCFPILLMSSIVASSEQGSRALFEYTWRFRSTPTGRAVPHAPSVAAAGDWRPCVKPRSPTPPTPAGPDNPRLGP